MNQASRFSGRDGIGAPLAAALFEAIIAAGQEAGRQAAEEEIQADNAPENKVEPLTNAPVGYVLLERHPTMNIALYEHRTEAHALTLIDGVVASLPNMSPEELFDLVTEAGSQEELEAKLNAIQEKLESEEFQFLGGYRLTDDGEYVLWAIYDLHQAKEALGDNYLTWFKGVCEFHDEIALSDDQEDIPPRITAEQIQQAD